MPHLVTPSSIEGLPWSGPRVQVSCAGPQRLTLRRQCSLRATWALARSLSELGVPAVYDTAGGPVKLPLHIHFDMYISTTTNTDKFVVRYCGSVAHCLGKYIAHSLWLAGYSHVELKTTMRQRTYELAKVGIVPVVLVVPWKFVDDEAVFTEVAEATKEWIEDEQYKWRRRQV